MSGQIGFNIEDAATLLNQLQQFNEVVRQDWSQVCNQWSNLQSVWNDPQYDQFEPLFEQLSSTYNSVDQACENFTSFLQEQIGIAEDRQAKMGNLRGM